MWQCPACDYQNEEPDSACVRCGELRPLDAIPAPPPDGTITAPVSAPGPVAPGRAVPQTEPSRVRSAWPVVLSILLLLLGGAALAYAAWIRGLIALPAQIEERLPQLSLQFPGQQALDRGGDAQQATVLPIKAQELLAEFELLPKARTRALEQALEGLAGAAHRMDAVAAKPVPAEGDTDLRAGQLADLDAALPELLASYSGFEDAAAKLQGENTAETLGLIREEYKAQLLRFIDLLGRVYLHDPQIARTEYTRIETLRQAVSVRGRLDPEEFSARWIAAVTAREERIVDDQFTAEYGGIAARRATLVELRANFNRAAESLQPVEISSGRLNDKAQQILELYDAFAYKIEDLWDEWVVFDSTLPAEVDRPRRMNEERRSLIELFQSEHLDCFSQVYRIYASDSELEHPAYEHLIGDHFGFVKSEWPNQAYVYQAVAERQEGEWDRNFRPNRDRSGGGGAGSGAGLLGPPGYDPTGPPAPNQR